MEKHRYLETSLDSIISKTVLQAQVNYIAFNICLNINTEKNLVEAFIFLKILYNHWLNLTQVGFFRLNQ